MSSNKASMPQLRPFHFGTHLLGNNFYLQPCWMRCSISTATDWVWEKKKSPLLNGGYHCKAQMIYNAALWLFYHAPSGKTALERLQFLTHCPLTDTHTMEQHLKSTLLPSVPTPIPKFQRRRGVLNSIVFNSVGSGILPQWSHRTAN